MKYGVGNEKCGEDVYGVMDVPHKNDCSEKDGGEGEDGTQTDIFPENKRHQKRKPRMRREKEVSAKSEIANNF